MNTIFIIGLVIVLVVSLIAGYFLGWKAGALDSARWATMIFEHGEDSIEDDERRLWLLDLLEQARRKPHKSVRERLEEDEVFQEQLSEQAENDNQ